MRVVVLALAIVACHSTPNSEPTPLRFPGALIGDVVSTSDAIWLLLTHPRRGAWPAAVLCRIDLHERSRCELIPATAKGARLVASDAFGSPLLALPDGHSTIYIEPFTGRLFRRVVGVAYDQPAVVLEDRSLWITEPANLVTVPREGQPRRHFSRPVDGVFVSPRDVAWSEGGRVMTAALLSGRGLLTPSLHPDVRPWTSICSNRLTFGILEADSGDLVTFGHGPAKRIQAGASGFSVRLLCKRDWVVALSYAADNGRTLGAWCSTAYDGECDRVGRGPFTLSVPRGTPFESGYVDVLDSGELQVLDFDGRRVTSAW